MIKAKAAEPGGEHHAADHHCSCNGKHETKGFAARWRRQMIGRGGVDRMVLRLLGANFLQGLVHQAHVKFPSNSRMARATWPRLNWSTPETNPQRSVLSQTALTRRGIP